MIFAWSTLKREKIEEIGRGERRVQLSSKMLHALFTTLRQITLLLLRDEAASLVRQNLDNSGFICWGQIKHAHGFTCVIEIFLFLRSVYFYLHLNDKEMLVSGKAIFDAGLSDPQTHAPLRRGMNYMSIPAGP